MSRSTVRISILSVIVATMCVSTGCAATEPSPPDFDGVRRITHVGRGSQVLGASWSPDSTQLALTWIRSRWWGSDQLDGYVTIIDIETQESRILTHTEGVGFFYSPAWSPTSDRIAFFSNAWGSYRIWVADIEDREALTSLAEGHYCAWGPNGDQLAIVGPSTLTYTISILDISTGEQQQVFEIYEEGKNAHSYGVSWSPTGDRLAFVVSIAHRNPDGATSSKAYLYELDVTSGESRLLMEAAIAYAPSWSPDGTMLAFVSGEGGTDRNLTVMQVDDHSVVKPLGPGPVGLVAWSPDGRRIAFGWSGDVYTFDVASLGLESGQQ